jgi:hypothetical protein
MVRHRKGEFEHGARVDQLQLTIGRDKLLHRLLARCRLATVGRGTTAPTAASDAGVIRAPAGRVPARAGARLSAATHHWCAGFSALQLAALTLPGLFTLLRVHAHDARVTGVPL